MKLLFKLSAIAILLLLATLACKRTENDPDMTEGETYPETTAPTAADSVNPSASGNSTTIDTTASDSYSGGGNNQNNQNNQNSGTSGNTGNNGNSTGTGTTPR